MRWIEATRVVAQLACFCVAGALLLMPLGYAAALARDQARTIASARSALSEGVCGCPLDDGECGGDLDCARFAILLCEEGSLDHCDLNSERLYLPTRAVWIACEEQPETIACERWWRAGGPDAEATE